MAKQYEFEGITTLPDTDTGNVIFFRRATDNPEASTAAVRSLSATVEANSPGPVQSVRIYTLGRFSLLLHGQPVVFGRKTPQRPLDLLKAVVACGGRNISLSVLTSALWPDSDGDTAKRALDTNLFRLRRILGDDRAIVLREGKISLDPGCCWTDVWAFERLLGRLNRIRNQDIHGREAMLLEQLSNQLLALYQDHFLAREEVTSWSVSIRERLRSKYIHNLLETGKYWESHGLWEKALACYQKGLEVDDLVEVFHQRLMICYLELQRYSEGMASYRRCCRVLSIVLGLQPEAETNAIFNALMRARIARRPA